MVSVRLYTKAYLTYPLPTYPLLTWGVGSDEGSESLSYHSSLSLVLLARTVEIDWTSPAFQSGTLRRGGIDLATARVPGSEVEAPRAVSARRKDISRGLAKVHRGTTTSMILV